MTKLFKVIAGIHFEDGNKHTKGQTVVSGRDLVKLFPGKFQDLGRAPDENDKVEEEEETAPETEVPESTKPETEKLPPAKTPKPAAKKKAAKKKSASKKKDEEWDD